MPQITLRCYARSLWAGLVVVLVPAGCASNRSQLTRCQEDKEQLLTTIRQQPEPDFVSAFMDAFAVTDWSSVGNADEWPS